MNLEPELVEAALSDNAEKAKQLLDNKANPNIYDKNGLPILLRLLIEKKENMAEVLLRYGADPNIPNKYGYNILLDKASQEVSRRMIDAMKFLLNHGLDPDKKYPNGMTSINITLESGNISIFKLLIQYSKDKEAIFATNSKGETILHLAAQQNDIDTFNLYKESLLSKAKGRVNIPDKLGYTPLYWAKSFDHKEIAQALIDTATQHNTLTYTRITAKESYQDLPPRPKIAVSYNAIIGGMTSEEVQKRFTEGYCEVMPIDYREVVSEIYNVEANRNNLEEIKKQATKKITELLSDKDALVIPGNNAVVDAKVANLWGGS